MAGCVPGPKRKKRKIRSGRDRAKWVGCRYLGTSVKNYGSAEIYLVLTGIFLAGLPDTKGQRPGNDFTIERIF